MEVSAERRVVTAVWHLLLLVLWRLLMTVGLHACASPWLLHHVWLVAWERLALIERANMGWHLSALLLL